MALIRQSFTSDKEFAVKSAQHVASLSRAIFLQGVTGSDEPLGLNEIFVAPSLTSLSGSSTDVNVINETSAKSIIIGAPGAGKTTLVKYLANRQAEAVLAGNEIKPIPMFFAASRLARAKRPVGIIDKMAIEVRANIGVSISSTRLSQQLSDGNLAVYIDGLDEITNQDARLRMATSICALSRQFRKATIIITSRPAGLSVPFDGFGYFHLEPFDAAQVSKAVHAFAKNNPQRVTEFLSVVTSNAGLFALSGNPLLLSLLWQIFRYRGHLPTNRVELYRQFSEYLLSEWDSAKRIDSSRSLSFSIRDKIAFLSTIALRMAKDNSISTSRQNLIEIAEELFVHAPKENSQGILDHIVFRAGILVERTPQHFSFLHKSFQEFYTASAISDSPASVVDLIRERESHEIVILACGMMVDIGPIIEAAIEQREIMLAAKCISNGRTRNRRIAEYVITSLLSELGDPFVRSLVMFLEKRPNFAANADEHRSLLNLLERALDVELTSQQKGAQFEEFASEFFGKLFKVVSRDLDTENGELDLVLELTHGEPFWSDFGGEALVECKNWADNVPLKEAGIFAHKVGTARGIKLAFIVSVSGFTDEALRTLKNHSADPAKALIVPIDGTQIKNALLRKDEFEEFFKEAIRGMKYLRKR